MKKVFLTAFIAAAFAFGMTSCCNNTPAEEPVDSCTETEVCEHHHECTCPDTTCAQNNCEGCVNCGSENCCKAKAGEQCCKAQGEKCCKAEGEKCCKHECEGNHEGCQHKCDGEKKECCKK